MDIDFSSAIARQEESAALDYAGAEDASKRADDKEIIVQQEIESVRKLLKTADELKARYPCEGLTWASKACTETINILESSENVYKERARIMLERAEKSAKRVIALKALEEKYSRHRTQFLEELRNLNETK